MTQLILHALTEQDLRHYAQQPAHGLLLIGVQGSGKRSIAMELAEQLLGLGPDGLANHPYALHIQPNDKQSIGIEEVRTINQFLNQKVPSPANVNRVIVIEDSQQMTIEAQNALLKTLEEPPAATILILTATDERALLATVRSRLQVINIRRPSRTNLEAHFGEEFSNEAIAQAFAMSGGLPGLMQELLSNEEHVLTTAAATARQVLQASTYERLLLVDDLAKQRQAAVNLVFILQQMAHIALQTADGRAAKRWQTILKASYEAAEALAGNAQAKLVLTDLMLTI